jgi:hypothetical protein
MVPSQNNSSYFAVWAALNGIAAGSGAIAAGWLSSHIHSMLNWLPFDLSSGFILIFIASSLMRSSSVLFLKNVREEKSIPVIKAVRILRSVRFWATTMGFHPLLQFFIPISDKENRQLKTPDYWPLWRTRNFLPAWFTRHYHSSD